jgi:TPR repeat protein
LKTSIQNEYEQKRVRSSVSTSEIVKALEFNARSSESNSLLLLAVACEVTSAGARELGRARDLYADAAKEGSAFAMYRLARLAEIHRGLVDDRIALEWANKASAKNYAPGLFALARLHEVGIGTCLNVDKARELFEQSAHMGFGPAAAHLAMALELGIWGVCDHKQAVHFAALAASLGAASAAQMLGRAYEDGRGVSKDNALALAWYTQAADSGDAVAALRLVAAYSMGALGAPVDVNKARHYAAIADG